MDDVITLRQIQDDDLSFLSQLYMTTRTDIAMLPWSVSEKTAFCHSQFLAQHRHYQQYFAGAEFSLILCLDQPAGRLYIDRLEHEIRLIDIALLPEIRGRGIGTALLRDLIDEANAAGKPLRLRVEPGNPARQWYEREGFRAIVDEHVNLHMERQPDPVHAGSS
ncbi:MAG: GNAT family N-acetyltransferase [Pirellulaceae bacterium]